MLYPQNGDRDVTSPYIMYSKDERDVQFLLRKLFNELFCFMSIFSCKTFFNFLSEKLWFVIDYTIYGALTQQLRAIKYCRLAWSSVITCQQRVNDMSMMSIAGGDTVIKQVSKYLC